MASEDEVQELANLSLRELVTILHGEEASKRTAAAIALAAYGDDTVDELLAQLIIERCLYTKIAICEALQHGNKETAITMARYLGEIGNNQHQTLPKSVSAKKSYPLPRDIIARTLAKMDTHIFPVLLAILETKEKKIREALDAIGFMTLYHQDLATHHNAEKIISVMDTYQEDAVIVWKAIMCLSAFPLPDCMQILQTYAKRKDICGEEARRSLMIIQSRG